MKNVLVLFDGNGCVSNPLKELGYNVITSDILHLSHIDIPVDIMNFNPTSVSVIPDIIWASPPCETWSIKTAMKGGGNMYWETIKERKKVVNIVPRTNFLVDKRLKFPTRITNKRITHTNYLKQTANIILFFQTLNPNLVWFIENPQTGFMKFYIDTLFDNVIHNKTTYCLYGTSYKKATNIFSNIKLDLKWCSDPDHHRDCFSKRWDENKQKFNDGFPETYLDRSLVPTLLVESIFKQTNNKLEFSNLIL
jgi:hypothetical protein